MRRPRRAWKLDGLRFVGDTSRGWWAYFDIKPFYIEVIRTDEHSGWIAKVHRETGDGRGDVSFECLARFEGSTREFAARQAIAHAEGHL